MKHHLVEMELIFLKLRKRDSMLNARRVLACWCESNLDRFDFDKVEFRSVPPDDTLDKSGLAIEQGNFVASFTTWGEQGTTEWLVVDIRSGETVISRDEKFSDAKQLQELVEAAMTDLQRLEAHIHESNQDF